MYILTKYGKSTKLWTAKRFFLRDSLCKKRLFTQIISTKKQHLESAKRTENVFSLSWNNTCFFSILIVFLFFLGQGCCLRRYVRRRSFYKYSGDNGGAIPTIQTDTAFPYHKHFCFWKTFDTHFHEYFYNYFQKQFYGFISKHFFSQ